jgi:threonine dehydratase
MGDKAFLRQTPLWRLPGSALGVGCGEVWLKLEHLQVGGSFKARGMLNRLLANPMPASGVIVASGGNAGIATAAAARALGVACEVFVPEVSPEAKRARLRDLGATVVVTGASYAEAFEACVARQRQTGALMTHAYDQSEVVAGAGTLAREIEAQGGRAPDAVLVSVGGGGLIGGVAAWFEQRCRVVALEPEGAPTLFRAREAGQPVDVAVGGIAADSLGARRIGAIAWQVTQQHVNDALLLPDDAIAGGAALALEGNEARSGAGGRAGAGGTSDRRLPAARGRSGGADSLWREPGSGEAGLSPSGSKPVRWGWSTKIGGC